MDTDVAILNGFATTLGALAGAIDTMATCTSTIATSTTGSGNIADGSSANDLMTFTNTIGSSAKVRLYTAIVQQAATDLASLTTGSETSQTPGDPAALEAIGAWINSFMKQLPNVDAAVVELAPSPVTAITDALAGFTPGRILVNGLSPAPSALARIALRISGLITSLPKGGGGGIVVGGGGVSLPSTSSSAMPWVIGGLAIAAVATYVVIRKKGAPSRRARR